MDLSYFEDPVEVLVAKATYNDEGVEISPAVYETQQQRKPTPRTKSLTDVERVIKKHRGKNDRAVDLFVAMYLAGVQWDWLLTYQEWQVACDAIDAENAEKDGSVIGVKYEWVGTDDDAVRVPVDVLYTPKPLPDEPPRPPLLTVEQWKINNYELLRSAAYPTINQQLAMQYDDSVNGTTGWIDMQEDIKAKYPKE